MFSAAIILDSTASFSLLNIRVLSSSATAPVFSIMCLRYLIGSLCINHHPFSCLVRFFMAVSTTKPIAESAAEPATKPVAFLISLLAYNTFSNFYAYLTVRLVYLISTFQPIWWLLLPQLFFLQLLLLNYYLQLP